MADDLESKAKRNTEIMHDPSQQNPALPIEAQLEKVGDSTPPIKDQYADTPATAQLVTSTHDRDSVQPPNPSAPPAKAAPAMPLKERES